MALLVFKTSLPMQVGRWVRLPPSPATLFYLMMSITLRKTMKDENISAYTLEEIEGQVDETDWDRVAKMTDEDLHKTAQSDPDSQPLTETELNCFKRTIYTNGEILWKDEQTVGELLANGEKYALIPVDREVLEWFEKADDRYLAKMNAVLRVYIESQED